MQAQQPNLPDRDERGYGVNINPTQCASPHVSFEEGATHCLDSGGSVLTNCKSPRKDGQIVSTITPTAAVEVIERESTVLHAGVAPMKITMAETHFEEAILCIRCRRRSPNPLTYATSPGR